MLADVHANAAALDAVLAAEPDCDGVLFLGDAVDVGPQPDVVCDRLRERDLVAAVNGNHDRAVLDADADGSPSDDPNARWQEWTQARLSETNLTFLEGLPRTETVALGDRTARLHHGDFRRPEGHEGSWPTRVTPEDDRDMFAAVADRYEEDLVLHGHSHYPFRATVDGTTFVNPGSVGLQRDGWPVDRARYASVEDGEIALRAVPFDPNGIVSASRSVDSPHYRLWDRPGTAAGSG